jgi:simple sugar transport system permease protein
MENIIPVIRSALTIMIPILFAASGGLFPALAGTLNIALEGLLLIGAFTSLAVFYFTGSITASLAAAAFISMLISALHAFTTFKLRANVFIAGLAVNLLTSGLCIVLSGKLFNTRGVVTAQNIQGLGNWYLFSGLFLLFIIWLVIFKTPFGYRLRACEKRSEALSSLGINPVFYKVTALLLSGLLCGIGGSFLSLNLGAFVPGMSAGKGWIALAVIFLGAKKPLGILAAAFVFAFAESFSNYAQGFLMIPADFILAFPYICTLIVMIAVSVFNKSRPES